MLPRSYFFPLKELLLSTFLAELLGSFFEYLGSYEWLSLEQRVTHFPFISWTDPRYCVVDNFRELCKKAESLLPVTSISAKLGDMDETQEATASTSIADRLRLNRTQLGKKTPNKINSPQSSNLTIF